MNHSTIASPPSSASGRTLPGPLFLAMLAFTFLACDGTAKTSAPEVHFDEAPIARDDRPALSLAPVVERVAPSVVNIYTAKTVRQAPAFSPFLDDPFFRQFFGAPFERVPRERRERSLGSGVIVSADGYILTNNHVVEEADEIKIVLSDERTTYDAKLVGKDPQTDIAVLKVDAKALPAITLTDSDQLRVGDFVLAIGNPLGVGQTVTSGIVSAKGRGGMGIVDLEDFIQTDASINPGNSGGALVDVEGRLVGINTAILSRSGGSQGIGFAVPANLARSIMERLIEDGKVTRGYLGVMIQPVTPELAREFKLERNEGALVGDVTPRSPAAKAGLESGDVIVRFDGRPVADARQLRLMVAQARPGTEVKLDVLRGGKPRTLSVRLEEMTSGGLARAERGSGGLRRGGEADPLDGVTVDNLDLRTRRQFNIPSHVHGALVMDVEPGSPAAAAGLRPGDVIVEIDREPVTDADAAVELSERLREPRVLLRVWSQGGSRFVVVDASRR